MAVSKENKNYEGIWLFAVTPTLPDYYLVITCVSSATKHILYGKVNRVACRGAGVAFWLFIKNKNEQIMKVYGSLQ